MLLVIGSINIDLVSYTDEIPKIGETVIGTGFYQYPGGKGANQAVCAAKLGAGVCFFGKVGADTHGDFMLGNMAESGVDIFAVEKIGTPTGLASISVDSSGQNSIIVIPGANSCLDREYIDRNINTIKNCNIILAQLEIPFDSVEYAFKAAKSFNKTTILNPAPAAPLSEGMIHNTDILVPNEHELSRITGMDCTSLEKITIAARSLNARGVKCIIVTMGSEGVLLYHEGRSCVFPAHKIKAVDTTAAGDCFLGGFARSYMINKDVGEAIIQGQLVASYSIQHQGAQSSMPSYSQFEEYAENTVVPEPYELPGQI